MSSINLTCYGSSKTLDIGTLEPYQIELVRGFVSHQIGKIRNRIIHKHSVPPQAMVKLQRRLSELIGVLNLLAGRGNSPNQFY